jgi:hypothetical protein
VSDAFRETAAAMALLPEGDPERAAFLEHARSCAECMQAFRQGEKLALLLQQAPLPAPSPEALQRARQAVLGEMRPARPLGLLPAAAAVLAFVVPLLFARHLDAEGWGAAILVLAAATALAATAGMLKAGGLVALFASAGFAFAAGGVPGFPHPGAGLVPKLGMECLIVELIAAVLPLAAAAMQFRRDPRPGALATAAAAGALAGQAALHLGCSAHGQAPHLWIFHVSGVALAALVGWTLEGRLSPSRA